jgi:hypothetical protein
MAVDYAPSWDGHDARRKCGIITQANVEGAQLRVAGYLYSKDFPEVERQMRACAPGAMGMSWELADAHVEDMRAEVWTLTRATFTGAAILLREKAAYRGTSFALGNTRCRSLVARAVVAEPAAAAHRNFRDAVQAGFRMTDGRKE